MSDKSISTVSDDDPPQFMDPLDVNFSQPTQIIYNSSIATAVSTYIARLREMFPLKSHKQIQEIVDTVLESSAASADENIEIMINMLMGDGEYGCGSVGEAVGFDKDSDMGVFYQNLLEMYPDICPQYLQCLLLEKGLDYENIVDQLNMQNYEKVSGADKDPLEIWDNLKSLLPDADPEYLKKNAFELATKSENEIRQFMETILEERNYPTMENYLIKEKKESKLRCYRNFDANKFLEEIPDPKAHFSSRDYKNPLSLDGITEDDKKYALAFLYNKYPYQRRNTIKKAFELFDCNLQAICETLDKFPKAIRNRRPCEIAPNSNNLPLLQEVTYLMYKPVIQLFINRRNAIFLEAEKLGLLETCSTCYDQLIPENCYFCRKGCVYCKECLRRWAGISIGNGNLTINCCDTDCNADFTLTTIKQVLDEDIFKTITERMQNEDLINAHIDGLELCPSCGFVVILNDNDKLIHCRNLKCRKISCRECKHDDHTPLKCNEVEYPEDVRLRTYVEDKMSEALIRKCYKCQKPYVKSSGCNKIICSCGAMMCYLCNQAINGYGHFEGNNPCKLHTNDNNVDLQRVRYGAQTAKRDLGNVVIKFDPEENLNEFYNNI